MKTKSLLVFASFAILVFSGCNKILKEDPKATITASTYYKTQSDLDAAVNAMYIVLARDGSWGVIYRNTSYFGSDDYTTDPGLNKQDFRDFDRLSAGDTNSNLTAEWNGPWACIYQANNVLVNGPKVSSTDDLKNASMAQAYFLRGLCYYYLVRTFGPVPLVLGTIDPNAKPPRADVAAVYASIISDLQTAKKMLGTAKVQGKPNTYSASGILADVYQTMAGWPLNQTSNYALAAAEANIVIKSGLYDVNTPYDQVFSTNNSSESMFALEYNVGANLPNRAYGATVTPLDEVAIDGSSGWDDIYPEINFFKNAPKCTRTDLTFYTTIKVRNADAKTFTLYAWNDPHTHSQHPYYKKYRSGLNGDGVNETATAINSIQASTNKAFDVLRYPEVLLDYAESSAMAGGGPTSDGYTAINLVRKRAGEQPLTPGLSQIAFRDSVVRERAYEFAGEFGMHWFDIVRLQLLPAIIASRDPSENSIPAGVNVQNKYLAPIPYEDIILSPQWKQNAGY